MPRKCTVNDLIERAEILSTLAKKAVGEQTVNVFTTHNYISVLRGPSYLNCPVDFLNLVTRNAGSHPSMLKIILNKKRFDRASYSRHLARIQRSGAINPIPSCMFSCLSESIQAVSIDGWYSQSFAITSGVTKAAPMALFYSCYILMISIMLFVMAHQSRLPTTPNYSIFWNWFK